MKRLPLTLWIVLTAFVFAGIIGCGETSPAGTHGANVIATASVNPPAPATTPTPVADPPAPIPEPDPPPTTPVTDPVSPPAAAPVSTPNPPSAAPTSAPNVPPTPDNVHTLTNLQANKEWQSWGQLAPSYADCDFPCTGVTWSMSQGVKTPSLSGNAAQFDLGGTTPYSDVLFVNHLIGVFSSQGLPDNGRTLVPTLNNFTYDADFYLTDAANTQAMEFDINMFPGGGVGMTWGTECRIKGGHEWDIWDNARAKWIPTGLACNPMSNGWNHVTVNVQRGAGNTLIYQSIVLNGSTMIVNKTYVPFTVPSDWYGITVNYQMDGDEKQTAIRSYLDNLSFKYW